ncbi:hypothetical protein [Streptomyces sp. NPDC059009]|uniref:hypothetical protein n=1 Tax=Streptomyces sp. NPDC059009 TaxID=3346694 RepID=UPI0036914318
MAVPRTLEDLRRLAENGDEGAAFLLAESHIEKGRHSKALKTLAPLAKAGNGRALKKFTDLTLSLARTDSRYQPSAEALLRSQNLLRRLAHEMRSWTGRRDEAHELLVTLAVEKGDADAAADLGTFYSRDTRDAVQWHCLAIELGSPFDWRELDHLLGILSQEGNGDDELIDRARRAVQAGEEAAKAQEKEWERGNRARGDDRDPDTVAIDLGVDDAAVIVGTAAAVPFVQALATQAGNDVYAWVRRLFGRAVGRESEELTESTTTEAALYVVGEPQTNTWLEMRGRPTDEALAKLAETDLESLAAADRHGRAVIVRWVPEAGEWQRRVE